MKTHIYIYGNNRKWVINNKEKSNHTYKVDKKITKGWIPPEHGWVKMNIDVSLIEKGMWGLGEITRNADD